MIDEVLRSRVASALEQTSAELALTDLVYTLKEEGISPSELIELYHEFLLNHVDDVDQTKHNALRKVLSTITGVAPLPVTERKRWTALRKAQFIAALFGAGVTFLFELGALHQSGQPSGHSETWPPAWFLLLVLALFAIPGWISDKVGMPEVALILAVVVNAGICAVLVTIIGRLAPILWIRGRAGVKEAHYEGPRCVSCGEPIGRGTQFCTKCGYTQPDYAEQKH